MISVTSKRNTYSVEDVFFGHENQLTKLFFITYYIMNAYTRINVNDELMNDDDSNIQ